MMIEKCLQKSSKYEQYDIDGDGIVSDEEFENMAKEKKYLKIDLTRIRVMNLSTKTYGNWKIHWLLWLVFTYVAMFFVDEL